MREKLVRDLTLTSLMTCCLLMNACATETASTLETFPATFTPRIQPSPTIVPSPTPNPPIVTYVDNSAFILSAGSNNILFDPHYLMPKELKEIILAGKEPFTELDMVLITHDHSDHFDPELTLQLLRDNPSAELISTQSVIEQVSLLAEADPAIISRLSAYEPEEGRQISEKKNGIRFEVLNLPHNYPVTNLGFLIDLGDLTVFNTGDIVDIGALDNYDLHSERIDLALIPYFFLVEEQFWDASGNNPLIEAITPQLIIPSHYSIPRGDLLLHRDDLLARIPGAVLFDAPLQTRQIAY